MIRDSPISLFHYFTIENCEQLNGNIEKKYKKSIREWHKTNKAVLVKQWNLTRPSYRSHTLIKPKNKHLFIVFTINTI